MQPNQAKRVTPEGNATLRSKWIPGTVVDRSRMNGAAGEPFLDKVFYVTEGIMLTQDLKMCLLHLLHWQVDS